MYLWHWRKQCLKSIYFKMSSGVYSLQIKPVSNFKLEATISAAIILYRIEGRLEPWFGTTLARGGVGKAFKALGVCLFSASFWMNPADCHYTPDCFDWPQHFLLTMQRHGEPPPLIHVQALWAKAIAHRLPNTRHALLIRPGCQETLPWTGREDWMLLPNSKIYRQPLHLSCSRVKHYLESDSHWQSPHNEEASWLQFPR